MKMEQVIDDYCLAWSEENEEKRYTLMEKALASGVEYTDAAIETINIGDL